MVKFKTPLLISQDGNNMVVANLTKRRKNTYTNIQH